MMGGQIRLTKEIDDAGTDRVHTGRIASAPLFTPGFLGTTGGTLQRRQTVFDRANQDIYIRSIRFCTWRQTRPRLSWWQCTHMTSAVPVATGRKRSRNWRRIASGSPTESSSYWRGVFCYSLRAQALPSENDQKPAINFDDDFDGGFQF